MHPPTATANSPGEAGPTLQAPPFTQIYAEHFDYVWRTLRRLGGEERHLDDLAHDVFLVVYRQLSTFDPGRPMKPWLFGITFRVLLDHKRKASFAKEVPIAQPERVDSSPNQEAQVESEELRRIALDALAELGDNDRAVLLLCEIDGATGPEAAEALKIPLNTAYSRLRLARGRFAEVAKRLLKTDPLGGTQP